MLFSASALVNLKFTMYRFFDVFGHHHPDNQGPTVIPTNIVLSRYIPCMYVLLVLVGLHLNS